MDMTKAKGVDLVKKFVMANKPASEAGEKGNFYISGEITEKGEIVVRNAEVNMTKRFVINETMAENPIGMVKC